MADFLRQLDIVSPKELNHFPILIVGTGGIGSPTALILAKMGCRQNLTLADFDRLESHNLPNQVLPEHKNLIGRPKVKVLANFLKALLPSLEIRTRIEKIDRYFPFFGIVILAVDSMDCRTQIWEAVKNNPRVNYFIDARMGGEVANIYGICPSDPDAVNYYQQTLFPDQEAVQQPCTAQTIIYTTFAVASVIAKLIQRVAKGKGAISNVEINLDYTDFPKIKTLQIDLV